MWRWSRFWCARWALEGLPRPSAVRAALATSLSARFGRSTAAQPHFRARARDREPHRRQLQLRFAVIASPPGRRQFPPLARATCRAVHSHGAQARRGQGTPSRVRAPRGAAMALARPRFSLSKVRAQQASRWRSSSLAPATGALARRSASVPAGPPAPSAQLCTQPGMPVASSRCTARRRVLPSAANARSSPE